MMSSLLALGFCACMSGSVRGGMGPGRAIDPMSGGGIGWAPLIAMAALALSIAVLWQLGWIVDRSGGISAPVRSAALRGPRLLYAVRFVLGAEEVGVRVTSEAEGLVERLKGECPEAWRVVLAPDAVGSVTYQSERILDAVEHLLAAIGRGNGAKGLHAQLRQVRDLMRRRPFARVQRVVDVLHHVAVMAVAELAPVAREEGGGRGFEVVAESGEGAMRR